MDKSENEDAAIQHVVDRLTDRFGDVPADVVENTVHDVHDSFDDARVRDYVPVIVEHDAKARLRRTAAHEDADGNGAVSLPTPPE